MDDRQPFLMSVKAKLPHPFVLSVGRKAEVEGPRQMGAWTSLVDASYACPEPVEGLSANGDFPAR